MQCSTTWANSDMALYLKLPFYFFVCIFMCNKEFEFKIVFSGFTSSQQILMIFNFKLSFGGNLLKSSSRNYKFGSFFFQNLEEKIQQIT